MNWRMTYAPDWRPFFKKMCEHIKYLGDVKKMTTDEQKMTHILSCVSTHTPSEMLDMITNMKWEDSSNIGKVMNHPTFPKELYDEIDRIKKNEEAKKFDEEMARIREEYIRLI